MAFPRPTARALARLTLVALAACSSQGDESSPPGSPPNLLLLVADDVGRDDLDRARTPRLDALAASGVRFDGVHAVTAICQPSRAALLTGRRPHASGVYGFYTLRTGVPALGTLLANAGYATGLVGKRHLTPVEAYGFDRVLPLDKAERNAARYVERVREFLDARDREAPFLLVVAFHDAHRPFGLEPEGTPGAPPPELPDLPAVRADYAAYLAAIERLDGSVGAVLDELDARGLSGSTLVLFTADHGPPFPFAKTTLYERGLAVPFLAAWPGTARAGAVDDGLRSLLDLVPTLLEVAGAPAPDGLAGASFREALFHDSRAGARERLFAEQTDHLRLPSTPMRSVRDERWQYVLNLFPEHAVVVDALATPTWEAMLEVAPDDAAVLRRVTAFVERPAEELYDLATDPHQLVNLAEAPEHAARRARMRRALVDQLVRTGDPFVWRLDDVDAATREAARPAYEAWEEGQRLRLERVRRLSD